MKRRTTRTTHEYSFTVLYKAARDGGYEVTVPSLPGLITFGRTFDEARAMAQDAIQCAVEALQKERAEIPREQSLLQERLVVAV